MNNLHIAMNSFKYASRILKETSSLVRSGFVNHVYITALHEQDLPEHQRIDDAREVWRVRLVSRRWPRIFIVQIFKYIEYCARVFFYARALNIKLVNIHTVDLLPFGVFLKWVLKAKLVYDPHELETEKNGMHGIRQAVARYVERMFIRHSDLVIVVGGGIRDWYRDKYKMNNIAAVLNCPKFQSPRRSRRLHEELKIREEKNILIYQGGLVRGRGVELLLEAFAGGDESGHVLVLMGYGELEPLVREYAAAHDNIFLKEAVQPESVLAYTASADVGISFIENRCLSYNLCLPNKLFEYIMAGLPVIVNDVPEMRRVVNEYKVGIVLDELTRQSVARALDEIERMGRDVLGENLRRAASAFSWQNQERVMLKAYDEHIGIHPRGGALSR